MKKAMIPVAMVLILCWACAAAWAGNLATQVTTKPQLQPMNKQYKIQKTRPVPVRTCPDPAITRIWADRVVKNSNGTYSFVLHGDIKNIGTAPYRSGQRQQIVKMFQGKTYYWGLDFGNLNRGGVFHFSQSVTNVPGGEFVTPYSLSIVYDPDILRDGNPNNDDCNLHNNSRVLNERQVQAALSHPMPTAATKMKYNLQPPRD